MTPDQRAAAIDAENRLQAVADSSAEDAFARKNATDYFERLSSLRSYLDDCSHRVVLIGAKGSGKSAFLSVLGGLIIGDRPSNKRELAQRSVLPIGAGGTTVCQIQIRTTDDPDCPERSGANYGITLIPHDDAYVTREIELFAENIWMDAHGKRNTVENLGDESREVEDDRVIRGMANCARRSIPNPDGTRTEEDPARALALETADAQQLATKLKQRAQIHHRTQTQWWFHESREESLAAVKKTLFDINAGLEPAASYPKTLLIWVPNPTGGESAFSLQYTDTKGYDGRLEGNGVLQRLLCDDRAVYLLCPRFEDAPGELFREFLHTVLRVDSLSQAADRICILILDHGKAEDVIDARGDRLSGQDFKRTDCIRNLVDHQLPQFAKHDRVLVLDVLQDETNNVHKMIETKIQAVRAAKTLDLEQTTAAAVALLENLKTDDRRAMEDVDSRLVAAFIDARPEIDRIDNVVSGIVSLLEDEHPSRVRAVCRRDGEYLDLNAYDAVRTGVEEWFQSHFRDVDTAMQTTFRSLERESRFARVADHLRQRRAAYSEAKRALGVRLAGIVSAELRRQMPRDGVWTRSSSEWGLARGFRARVLGHIESFGVKQQADSPLVFTFAPEYFGLPSATESK